MTTDKVTYTIESDYPATSDAAVTLINQMGDNLPATVKANLGDHLVTATIIGDCYEILLIEATIKAALPPSLRIIDTDVTIGAGRSIDA